MKKRKLNSKNPKYMTVENKDIKKEIRRTKICMVPFNRGKNWIYLYSPTNSRNFLITYE